MSKFDRDCDKVIVGSNLSAVLYSFFHSVPIIFLNKKKPEEIDYFAADVDLSKLFFDNTENLFRTPEGEVTWGLQKVELWTKLMFSLNAAGLILGGDRMLSLRVQPDEGMIRGLTVMNGLPTINFNQLIVFDDTMLRGLPEAKKKCDLYNVTDFINVNACGPHELDYVRTGDKFVKEFHFVQNHKLATTGRTIMAMSELTLEEIYHFDYSDTMSRFKVAEHMVEAGIKGPKNGVDPQDSTKQRYHQIRLTTSYRKTEKKNMDSYDDTDNLTFVDLEDTFILSHYKPDKNSEQYRILKLING